MASLVIETDENSDYSTFFPVVDGRLSFRVCASNDACLVFKTRTESGGPMIEVQLGTNENSKTTIILHDDSGTKPFEIDTPNILKSDDFRGFWISWKNAPKFNMELLLEIGHEGKTESFIVYLLPKLFMMDRAAVKTGHGCSGSWEIDIMDYNNEPGECEKIPGRNPEWVEASNGFIPQNAILGGFHNGDLYICRARHQGSVTPGYVKADQGCKISWGGNAHNKNMYEVLCGGNGQFIQCEDAGEIPDNAFEAGQSEDGEPLFIGRVNHNGSIFIGKVQPSHEVLYIPFNDRELPFREFEIFVVDIEE